jgi:hypothetical protein
MEDAAAIYDPVRNRMIVSGTESGERRSEYTRVWALSLADPPRWTELHPDGPLPPRRSDHAATYDPVRDRMVIFGGSGNAAYMNDVWMLNWGEPVAGVSLDLSPGDPVNEVSLSQDFVAAAVLTTDDFDALTLNPETVTVAGAPVASDPGGRPMAVPVDLNADRRRDYCLTVRVSDMRLEGERRVLLEGRTWSGQTVRGRDVVRVVEGTSSNATSGTCTSFLRSPTLQVLSPTPWRSIVLEVTIGISGPSPATLDLFDLAGRRVFTRSLDGLGAGEHRLGITAERRLASGLYLLRLEQGGQVETARVLRVQ